MGSSIEKLNFGSSMVAECSVSMEMLNGMSELASCGVSICTKLYGHLLLVGRESYFHSKWVSRYLAQGDRGC